MHDSGRTCSRKPKVESLKPLVNLAWWEAATRNPFAYRYPQGTNRLEEVTGNSPGEVGWYGHDNVGNLESDPSGGYDYTPFSLLRQATINLFGGGTRQTEYRYDGDNQRYIRLLSDAKEVTFRDVAGTALSEYRAAGAGALIWQRDYVYLGSRLLLAISAPQEPTIAFAAASGTVGEASGSAVVTVVLSTPTPLAAPLAVSYATTNGSATDPTDYLSASGPLAFPAGSANGATLTISVPIVDKVWHEPSETFTVTLSNVTGGLLGSPSTHEVTILDDDPAQPPPGDINGDHHPDLVWRNISTGGNAFWLMNGPVQTATPPFLANGDLGWEIRGFGDLNGDTHPDVIWQHATLGRLAVWFFTGTTLLSTEYIDCTPDPNITDCVEPDLNWKIMAAADMDQDATTDLVNASSTGEASTPKGRQRQLAAFYVARAFRPAMRQERKFPPRMTDLKVRATASQQASRQRHCRRGARISRPAFCTMASTTLPSGPRTNRMRMSLVSAKNVSALSASSSAR